MSTLKDKAYHHIISAFDSEVRRLSKVEYRDLMEELIEDFKMRLEGVQNELEEENANAGED